MQNFKNQQSILAKLGIQELNDMQLEAKDAIHRLDNIVLLSPTGTGKTLAFLLPLVAELDQELNTIQALIIVPSRELAIQVGSVLREMGSGFKVNTVYGGQPFSKDKTDLQQPPAILIGTPGRIADHIRRDTFDSATITSIVLDEFDKSLEVGFEDDLKDIIIRLPALKRRVLTSATRGVNIPAFIGLESPEVIDYSSIGNTQLEIKRITSPTKDKLDTLVKTISHMGNKPGIIFCNFKETIDLVSNYLHEHQIEHGCFFGGMEQIDRERALIKFRNGTHQVIVATDLAARGIDVSEIAFIIHYHLPHREQEFTHRNGRTARMNANGTAYVLQWVKEDLPEFIRDLPEEELQDADVPEPSGWSTLLISGGRKDKISKGDIAGLFFKQAELEKDELGLIEIKRDCSFAAVKSNKVLQAIEKTNNGRVKKRKVRVYLT